MLAHDGRGSRAEIIQTVELAGREGVLGWIAKTVRPDMGDGNEVERMGIVIEDLKLWGHRFRREGHVEDGDSSIEKDAGEGALVDCNSVA